MSGGIHHVVSGTRASRAAVECLESRTLFNAGDPDLSFGISGATVPVGPPLTHAFQVVEQPDHKLVEIGKLIGDGTFNGDLVVGRFLPNGAPDTSYDGDGWKAFATPANFGRINGAEALPNGKVVIVGQGFQLLGLTSDLQPDPSFGQNGFVASPFIANPEVLASDMAVQGDGKTVVGGTSTFFQGNSRDKKSVAVRYNTDGTLDSSFGTGGVATVDVLPGATLDGAESVNAVAVLSDGRIVLGDGTVITGINGAQGWALVGLLPNGQVDTTFGPNGNGIYHLTPGSNSPSLGDLRALPGGGFLAAGGVANTGADGDVVVGRFLPNGSKDTTFGTGGFASAHFQADGLLGTPLTVVAQPDGKVVVGALSEVPSQSIFGYAAARFLTDGTLDLTFGRAGRAYFRTSSDSSPGDMIMSSDGKFVFAGAAADGMLLVRLLGGSRPNFRAPVRAPFVPNPRPPFATAVELAMARRAAPARSLLTE